MTEMLADGRTRRPDSVLIRDLAGEAEAGTLSGSEPLTRARERLVGLKGPMMSARTVLLGLLSDSRVPNDARPCLEDALDSLSKTERRLEEVLDRLDRAEERFGYRQ